MKGQIAVFGIFFALWSQPFGMPVIAQSQSCNPYRSGYEKAIAQGVIQRPSLVSNAKEAYEYFQSALKTGDRIEVAVRAVQYLVIVSEDQTGDFTDLERLDLEQLIVDYYQKPVEVAVPMLTVILPNNVFCPVN